MNICEHLGTSGNIWEHLGTSRKLIGTHKAICRDGMDWMGSLKHSHTRAPLCGANKQHSCGENIFDENHSSCPVFQSNDNGEADCVGVARGGAESVYKSRSF